jgi:hypothetical protein
MHCHLIKSPHMAAYLMSMKPPVSSVLMNCSHDSLFNIYETPTATSSRGSQDAMNTIT